MYNKRCTFLFSSIIYIDRIMVFADMIITISKWKRINRCVVRGKITSGGKLEEEDSRGGLTRIYYRRFIILITF